MELEEALHPDITKAIEDENVIGKTDRIINTIHSLKDAGHDPGITSDIGKGSSRIYMRAKTPEKIIVDGKPHDVPYGVKTAVSSWVDGHMDKKESGHDSMGRMHNAFENGNSSINKEHRVLAKNDDGTYSYNPHGIFPPLLDHDEKNHNWSKVGHARDIDYSDFQKNTVNDDYPDGIEHEDFHNALKRKYESDRGKYRAYNDRHEKSLDHAEKHPLTQAFISHQVKYGAPPYDYHLENLGVFRHDRKNHIVARDHGYSEDAQNVYAAAR